MAAFSAIRRFFCRDSSCGVVLIEPLTLFDPAVPGDPYRGECGDDNLVNLQ